MSGPSRRPTNSFISPSPGGGSTRITSAPQSASVRTQDGPARAKVRSITLKRESGKRAACDDGVVLPVVSTGLCILIVHIRIVRRLLASLEPRFALFHEGRASFAEILGVHAGRADIPDRAHVALAG